MRLLLALPLLLCATGAVGQPSSWAPLGTSERSVSLVGAAPSINSGSFSFPTSAWFLSTVYPANTRIRLIGDVPVAYMRWHEENARDDFNNPIGSYDASRFVIGNVGIGLESIIRSSLVVGLGLRLPTAPGFDPEDVNDKDARLTRFAFNVGQHSDPSRYGAFMPQTASAYGTLQWLAPLGESAWEVRIRATPALTVSWGSQQTSAESEIADYTEFGTYISTAAHVFYTAKVFHVGGGLVHTAFVNFNDELWVFAKRTGLAVGALAEFDFGRYRPSAIAHLPIAGEDKEFVDMTVGLGITVVL